MKIGCPTATTPLSKRLMVMCLISVVALPFNLALQYLSNQVDHERWLEVIVRDLSEFNKADHQSSPVVRETVDRLRF